MSQKQIIFILAALAILGAALLWKQSGPPKELYETEKVAIRDIAQTVFAAGTLEAKDQVKVGSLVTGVIKELYVEESDQVEKGQLLAIVETGIADTAVRQARESYFAKKDEVYFLKREYERQQKLYEKKYVSDSAVDEAERLYKVAETTLLALKASWDQAAMQYENTNIRSPASGIVTAVGIAKGERVTTDLNATIICEIAPDVAKMEAKLNIDERDIGFMRKGQKVSLTVDAYPDKGYETVISSVSFSPKKTEQGPSPYQVNADVDNPQLLLRPRMSLSGVIDVSSVQAVPSVSSRVFLLKREQIDLLAKILGYTVVPYEKKSAFQAQHRDENVSYVWQITYSDFKELPVIVGINNGVYYQIKEGLKGNEELIVSILEVSELKKIAED